MEPNNNYFTNRKEVFFVEYDGVIKNPNQYLLYLLCNELYETYKDYLHIEKYKGLNLDNALVLATAMTDMNIISVLTKDEIDFVNQYKDLHKWAEETYSESELLKMGDVIINSLRKPFLEKVYFYSKEYDKRIEDDIREIYGSGSRFAYCYGEVNEIIEIIPEEITAVFLGNYDLLFGFSNYSKLDFTEFYVSEDVRNGYFTEEADKRFVPYIMNPPKAFEDKNIKLHSFRSHEFKNRHMEGIMDPIVEKYIKLKQEKQ